ncbi:DSPc-domain-containing protein [Coemansia reversa NRRL 1564]|uniref:protein-tyrosine-phosphatase n=1 Tax=Coemansia reversa (strain ATCC 12441 / NRRL 1564) TaxID=763665 RepID=A0A2G5B9T4_COERN|nr:DSPc-domain-containing protein [Coemansia reversa NRRL 1564]|eukprot:PIA15771.1 DSPc-domain-containing protein [Coemansia reversa NRRL 1564]
MPIQRSNSSNRINNNIVNSNDSCGLLSLSTVGLRTPPLSISHISDSETQTAQIAKPCILQPVSITSLDCKEVCGGAETLHIRSDKSKSFAGTSTYDEVIPSALPGEDAAARRAARTYSNGPQMIMPYLYLGGEGNVCGIQLGQLGVDNVLNVAREVSMQQTADDYRVDVGNGHQVCYHHLRWDHDEPNLACYFAECFEFIDRARINHEGILVHCQLGVSRSASLVIAYVMRTMDLGFGQAYEYVRLRAPCISPNISLISQLCEFGRVLEKQRLKQLVITTNGSHSVNTDSNITTDVPGLSTSNSLAGSEDSSPIDNSSSCSESYRSQNLTSMTSSLITTKPLSTGNTKDPLTLHVVAHRHPLVP